MGIVETINNFIKQVTETNGPETINILIAYLSVTAIIILLRIIITSGYQAQYIIFSIKTKKGTEKVDSDISIAADATEKDSPTKTEKKSKFGLVSRVMNDYRLSRERGVNNIDTESIIKKYLLRLKFIIWPYPSMEKFVENFEIGLLFIGVLLTFYMQDKLLFTLLTVSTFVVIRLIAAFCDFHLIKDRLVCELSEYVERELADITNMDINASISKFSREVYTAIMKQSDIIKDSVDKMGSNLTGALALSVSEMTKAVEVSLNKSTHFAEELEKPLQHWVESINSASLAQEKINIASESLNEVVNTFNESSKSLSANFDSYIERGHDQVADIRDHVNVLVNVIEELKQANNQNKIDYDTIAKQLEYIDKNQSLLEQSIQQYEGSLESITSKMGEAFGSIVELQMQSSYSQLNDMLNDNMGRVNNANNEVLSRLSVLFDSLQDQTVNQTQTIVKIKEQMDMQFDYIREKI